MSLSFDPSSKAVSMVYNLAGESLKGIMKKGAKPNKQQPRPSIKKVDSRMHAFGSSQHNNHYDCHAAFFGVIVEHLNDFLLYCSSPRGTNGAPLTSETNI